MTRWTLGTAGAEDGVWASAGRLTVGRSTVLEVRLHAASRPHGDTLAEAHEWVLEGEDYDALVAQARGSVPEGWDLLYLHVDRG